MMQEQDAAEVSVESASGKLPWSSLEDLVIHAAQIHQSKEFLRIDNGRKLSFAEFEEQTARVANVLLETGVAPGDRVAIYLTNQLEWPVAWIGILRAGAVAVPVNAGYKESDLEFVLHDSSTRAVITEEKLVPRVDSVKEDCSALRHVLLASTITKGTHASGLEKHRLSPDTTANFQYTSGTTGFPKACVLTHAYWLRTGMLAAAYSELRRTDVVLTAQRYSYIDPLWNTVMCLIAGATLVILERFSASRFWPAVRRHGVTFFYVLGTMPTLLFKQPESGYDHAHQVRLVQCSGIPIKLHDQIEQRWGVPWREVYGLTETGIDLAVPSNATETVGTGAIGKPVPTKHIKIVDDEGNPVLPGQRGELLVKGDPIMTEYYRRPEATQKTISQGWLHTGDIVYEDASGWIHIVGRIKDMVRRGGENIASAEVESILGLHSAVLACAVTPVPDEIYGEEVKAYIQLRPDRSPDTDTAADILNFATERLAHFKIPRFLEYVSSFPMTPSERISKAKLLQSRPNQRQNSYDRTIARWA